MLGSHSLRSLFLRPGLAGCCLLLAAAAVACGGGEEATPSSTASPSPAGMVEPTVEPLPTIDPAVPLTEYHSPEKGYSIGYPEDWVPNASPTSPVAFFGWSLEGRPIAQLTVFCSKGDNQTLQGLMDQDITVAARYGGGRPTDPTDIELAGVPGKQRTYTTGFGGLTIEQVAAYAVAGNCGWRIALATYGASPLEAYMPLFQRILASFRLD